MDPNAALENILTGCMIDDHAEALSEWLARDGFAPAIRTLPELDRCAVFVREHVVRHYRGLVSADCTTSIRVRADRNGLWTAPPEGPIPFILTVVSKEHSAGQWISLAIWPELFRMGDAK